MEKYVREIKEWEMYRQILYCRLKNLKKIKMNFEQELIS